MPIFEGNVEFGEAYRSLRERDERSPSRHQIEGTLRQKRKADVSCESTEA